MTVLTAVPGANEWKRAVDEALETLGDHLYLNISQLQHQAKINRGQGRRTVADALDGAAAYLECALGDVCSAQDEIRAGGVKHG